MLNYKCKQTKTNIQIPLEKGSELVLKKERLRTISDMVEKRGIVTVADMMNELDVSDMTVRRDLDELEAAGHLVRVHGGAQSISYSETKELSHLEKKEIHIHEKKEVARIAASFIEEGDTVFLGPGTTIELMADYLNVSYLRVVTNSLPVFEKIQTNHLADELYLIGGSYRERTGAFVGSIANETIQRLKVTKAFIGVNGIHNNHVFTSNIEEGKSQKLALDNAHKKIIVSDHHKLNREDFYSFYELTEADYLITDTQVTNELKKYYSQYVKIISDKGEK